MRMSGLTTLSSKPFAVAVASNFAEPGTYAGASAPAQRERERRASARHALDGQLPLHAPGEIARDREAQPEAVHRVIQRATHLDEGLEHAFLLVQRNPG